MENEQDWTEIAARVAEAVRIIAPIAAGVTSPAVGAGILIAAQIVDGAMKGVPAAKALLDQINSGSTPSAEDLQKYLADYDAAHDDLAAAIADAKARNAQKRT